MPEKPKPGKSKNGMPTSADVARLAGVSRTTVSFVLNNKRDKHISERTRTRVYQAVQELGYTPDKKAVDLAKSFSWRIGVISDHSDKSHFSDALLSCVFEGMNRICNALKGRLIYLTMEKTLSEINDPVSYLNLDAVIVLFPRNNEPLIDILENCKIPFVVLGSVPEHDVFSVDIDDDKVTKSAVRYLIERGCRKIAMIAHTSRNYAASNLRIQGYKKAMEKAGLPVYEDLIVEANYSEKSGYDAARHLWKWSKKRPEAIFAGNDEVAAGVLSFFHEKGLTVPKDVSIIGIDDHPMSQHLYPALTTMAIPADDLGRYAMSQLGQLYRNEVPEQKNIILPSRLIIRETVR